MNCIEDALAALSFLNMTIDNVTRPLVTHINVMSASCANYNSNVPLYIPRMTYYLAMRDFRCSISSTDVMPYTPFPIHSVFDDCPTHVRCIRHDCSSCIANTYTSAQHPWLLFALAEDNRHLKMIPQKDAGM